MRSAIFTVFFSLTIITPAFGLTGRIDPEKLRKHLAEKYAAEFAQEFNSFSQQDAQDIYGYFMPATERKKFFESFKSKPTVRAEQNTLIFELPKQPEIKIEIIDMLEQRYKINGRTFVYDWSGSMLDQHTLIKNFFRPPANADARPVLWDLVIPRANAVAPLLVYAGMATWEMCMAGGCAALIFVGGRAAIFVAANAAVIETVAATAGRSSLSLARAGLQRAGAATARMGRAIIEDPEIKTWLASTGQNLSNPAVYIKAPFKAVGFMGRQIGSTIGSAVTSTATAIGFLVVNNELDDAKEKKKIPKGVGFYCLVTGHAIDEKCPHIKTEIPTTKNPIKNSIPKVEWCPTTKVNETQVYTDKGNGVKIGVVLRSDTSEKKQGTLISALRFETQNGLVDLDKVRFYQLKNSEITDVIIPKFENGHTIPESSFVTVKKNFTGADAAEKAEEDMHTQILKREQLLKIIAEPGKEEKISGQDLKALEADPIKTATASNNSKLVQEYKFTQDVETAKQFGAEICKLYQDNAKDTPPAAVKKANAAE